MSSGNGWKRQNKWFILAVLFLVVNGYGILQMSRTHEIPHASDVIAATAVSNTTTVLVPPPPAPTLISVLQTDVNADDFPVMELKFSHLVSTDILKTFMTVTDSSGEPRKINIYDREPDNMILFALEAETHEKLTLNIRKGFFAEDTPTPIPTTIQRPIPLAEGVSLIDLAVESPSFEPAWIRLRFSRPMDTASLQRSIHLQPNVDFSLVQKRNWRYGCYYELHGNLEKGRNYHLVVEKGVKAASGNTRLTRAVERTLFITDAKPAIRIRLKGNYLSPRGRMLLPIESINTDDYRIKTAKIPAHNVVQFAMRSGRHYQGFYGSPDANISIPGTSRLFRVESPANVVTPHVADLHDLLPDDPRGGWMLDIKLDSESSSRQRRLLVVTDIGITAKHNGTDLLVWANSIHDLSAVSDATVKVWSQSASLLVEGRTDAAGVSTLAIPDGETPFMVTVEKDHDLAYLDLQETQLPALATPARWPYLAADELEAFVYTDRGIYRPGEQAHIRAIVRGKYVHSPSVFPVELHIVRPDGRPYKRLQAMLSAFGTVEFDVPWAEYDPTGTYRLSLKTPGAMRQLGSTSVALEEFVPPRIAVDAQTDEPDYDEGDEGRLKVTARYLHGAPAGGCPVNAQVDLSPVTFESPHFPDYRFGDSEKSMTRISKKIGSSRLDADGVGFFPLPLANIPDAPSMVRGLAVARVMEQGGRTVSCYTGFDVHPYPYYIGLRGMNLNDLRPGDDGKVGIVMVDPDGQAHPKSHSLEVKLERIEWTSAITRDGQGRYHYRSVRQLVPTADETIVTDTSGTAEYTVSPDVSGHYLLRVVEPKSGASTSLEFYTQNTGNRWQSRSMEHPERVELKWDKQQYQAGDLARLSVTAPFDGKALLTIEQDRILSHSVQELSANTTVFDIPVTTNHQPNAHVFVNVIREVAPSPGQMVYRAAGSTPLLLDDAPLRLNVDIEGPDQIRPLSRLDLNLKVTDDHGDGQSTEVAVALVDEGICMLTDFETPDPVQYFAGLRRYAGITSDLYAMLLPETDPESTLYSSPIGGDIAKQLRGRLTPIRSKRFKPLALWQSGVMTDHEGRCRVSFEIPEFSGSVRAMVVAVGAKQFGSADKQIIIKRPFRVLSSLPRFLAPGDTCSMPMEVFNETKTEQDVSIEIRSNGPVDVDLKKAEVVRIPAGGRAPVNVTVTAKQSAGLGQITIEASMGTETFSQTTEIAVRPPSPAITIHDTFVLAPGEKSTVTLPDNWLPGSTSVTLQTDGLPSGSLGGGLDYLVRYPYGCLEQTVSSSMPLLYIDALQREISSTRYINDVRPMVRRGINRVLSMQLANGAFGWWPKATEPYEWGSVYAMHFLIEAERAGYDLPEYQRNAGLEFMRALLSRPVISSTNLKSNSWQRDAALRSYACLVLALADAPRHDWTARLREQTRWMTRDSRLRLVLALAAGGRRRDAFAELQALEDTKEDPANNLDEMGSPARTAAIELIAWLELSPDDASIPNRLRRLESTAQRGRWRTTQENGAAITAISRYIRHTASKASTFSGEIQQAGIETAISSVMEASKVQLPSLAPVTLYNNGPGPLYANWQVRGVPLDGIREEHDRNITIRRSFLDSNGNPAPVDSIQQGDLRVICWEIDTHGRTIDHLVVEDLLPAGLEIENARLKTSQLVPWVKRRSTLPVRHQDIRDDRLIVFTDKLYGKVRFYYAVRAVTPGRYIRPPVRLSAMYDPEVESVHDGGHCKIESRKSK